MHIDLYHLDIFIYAVRYLLWQEAGNHMDDFISKAFTGYLAKFELYNHQTFSID